MSEKGKDIIVKPLSSPMTTEGKHFRLLSLSGKQKGLCYFLVSKRIVIGRGDGVSIKIDDSKSSREHVELVKGTDTYTLTDLKSQNGTMVNEKSVTQYQLKDNDRIIIGQTVFKYNILTVAAKESATENEEKEEVVHQYQEKVSEAPKSNPLKLVIIGVVAVAAGLLFFSGDEGSATKKVIKDSDKKLTDVTDAMTMMQKKKHTEEKETKEKVDAAIHRGLREYREKNYFRAINEFNFALVLSPSNSKANFYLSKTKQAIDEEIETNFIKAKRDIDALKYSGSTVSYCAIVKLLASYPEDQRYKDALTNIRVIETKMGLDEGEIKCFEVQ